MHDQSRRVTAKKTLIIACGALAHEILAILRINHLSHMALECLPAELHNTPQKIPQAVKEKIIEGKSHYDTILVAYGDCGTGGKLKEICDQLDVDMINAPHCYAFFEGTSNFEQRDEMRAFYLTDFLAKHFSNFVIKPLGLDRYPDLKDVYFSEYRKLIFLAQTNDAHIDQLAQNAAEYLGLEYERMYTGYGELPQFIQQG